MLLARVISVCYIISLPASLFCMQQHFQQPLNRRFYRVNKATMHTSLLARSGSPLDFSITHITGIHSHSMKHDAQRVVIEQFDSVSSAFLQLVNIPLRFRSIDFGKLWTCLRQAGCGRLCSLRWSSVLAHTLPAAPAIDHFACKTGILSNNSIAGSITGTPQTTMLRLNFSATHITGIYSH